MKNTLFVLAGLILLSWTRSVPAFDQPFSEEPYIHLNTAQPIGDSRFRFHIQHYFVPTFVANYPQFDINSMNYRFGSALTGSLDLYLTGFSHSTRITHGADTAMVTNKGYEVNPVYCLWSESNGWPVDLALSGSAGRSYFDKVFIDEHTLSQETNLSAQVIAARSIGDLGQVSLAPIWVHGHEESGDVFGLQTGIKLYFSELLALVAEHPLRFNAPFAWKQPWSVGVQFHVGPHVLSIFGSSQMGFTAADLLQGSDWTYVGFRFSW